MLATMVARISFSPLVPAITDSYGVSNGLIGVALTGMWFTYGMAQFPSGVLANRYGERRIILVATGGTMLTCLLITAAPLFFLFTAGTILLGAVAGMHYSVATTLLSRTYDNVGTAIGVHHLGGAVGGLLGPIGASWLLDQYGWQQAVIGSALIAGIAFVLFLWRVRPVKPQNPDSKLDRQSTVNTALQSLRRPRVALLMFVTILIMFVLQGLISFLPTFFVEFYQRSTELAGILFAIFFGTQAVMQTGVGVMSDHIDSDKIISSCLAVGIVGFGLLLTSGRFVVIVAGSVLLGFGAAVLTVLIAQIMNSLPEGERSSSFGLTQSVVMVGGSLGSVSVGLLADLYGWHAAFSVLTALFGLAFLTYVLDPTNARPTSRRSEPTDSEQTTAAND
ncbi:MFS transporter [Halobium palmae]|uniref:MFS transporter n=1 Tax=Halobium palmae TaxID=1776492 RepID=A0ABD5RVC8_9EURY